MMEYIPGESQITMAANSLCTGLLGELTTTLYKGFQPMFATSYVLIFVALLAWRRRDYRVGLTFGITVALTWLPVVFFKMVFSRPRPDISLLPNPPEMVAADWSFPSGHTAFVAALMVATFIFSKNIWVRIASITLVMAISATVLIVGVHYPTDVLVSLIWSGCFGPVVAMVVRLGSHRLPELAR